jgi:hypothetical protein
MKKMVRQFRLPFKSTSPNFKKKGQPDYSENHNRIGLSVNKQTKKPTKMQTKPFPKSNTETGSVIKKVSYLLVRKKMDNKKQKRR